MAELTIKNFKGLNLNENRWQEGFAGYAVGTDVFGLGDNKSKNSFPGVIQGMINTSAMSEGSGVSAVTESVQDISYFTTDQKFYAMGRVNPARIYRNTSANEFYWVSAITTSGNGNNLLEYDGYLYYACHSYLGRYDGTNGNANFQAWTDTLTSPRPMRVFEGSLYIGAGRYVAKYDGTTFTEKKLTLPDEFVVRSIETYRGRLFLTADNGQVARLYIWDGVSNTYEQAINIDGESSSPSMVTSNGILWFASNRGTGTSQLTSYISIYVYDGSLNLVMKLPGSREGSFAPPSGICAYRDGILVGSTHTTTSASFEDGAGGVWYIGKMEDGSYQAVLAFSPNANLNKLQIDGLFSAGNNTFFGVTDFAAGTKYEIHQLDTTNRYSIPTAIWQSLPIDAGSTGFKNWRGVKLNFETLTTGQTVVVKYRLDDASSFTTLKTFTVSTSTIDQKAFIPILRTSRTITLRVELTASDTQSTRLHGVNLDFDLCNL